MPKNLWNCLQHLCRVILDSLCNELPHYHSFQLEKIQLSKTKQKHKKEKKTKSKKKRR
jgi:hypothetical protein